MMTLALSLLLCTEANGCLQLVNLVDAGKYNIIIAYDLDLDLQSAHLPFLIRL